MDNKQPTESNIMLRKCEKKIYCIKNPGGKYFEEAYLVLKSSVPEYAEKIHTQDLAAEAERIIREAGSGLSTAKAKSSPAGKVICFALGAASSSAIIGTVALLISLG